MKTKQLFYLGILGLATFFANAQVTTPSNTVTATAYIGSGATSNFDVLFKRNNVAAGKLATTFTNFGLNSNATPNSVAFGVNAGQFSSGTGFNTYIGHGAGKGQSVGALNSGISNTYIGFESGLNTTTGSSNIFVGTMAGKYITTGSANVLIGAGCADAMNSGIGNVFLGDSTGNDNNGNFNIFIGYDAGSEAVGSSNIFIGNNTGYSTSGDKKLIIENSDAGNPLIYGDFAADQLKFHGKVGIGGNSATAFGNFPLLSGNVNVSSYNLFVKGGILTDEVRVSTTWADYVFAKNYKLPSLADVERHIQEKGHLINVPSAQEVEHDGIELGEMAKIQQEKIEELTLYIIEQNKINQAQNKLISELSERLTAIEKR